jgi:hypothetical protein
MGYYTTYKWSMQPESQEVRDWLSAKQTEEESFAYGIAPDGELGDETKWYDHDVDMKEMSRQFPDILFTLEGEGEEAADLWKKFYKNGKQQTAKAKISFDQFDPIQLK